MLALTDYLVSSWNDQFCLDGNAEPPTPPPRLPSPGTVSVWYRRHEYRLLFHSVIVALLDRPPGRLAGIKVVNHCCHGWEHISEIWEAVQWQEILKYLGGWHPTNAVIGACVFKRCKPPLLRIQPRSLTWHAIMTDTILWRNQIDIVGEVSNKYKLLYSTIHISCTIAPLLRNSRYLYCAQVRSNLVRREWYGHCTKLFVVLLVMQGWSSRW